MGNKIYIQSIERHEITLAKCGMLSLIWDAHPLDVSNYKLKVNGATIYNTLSINEAIKKYNELVC